jgi:hypothetical protein
MKSWKTTLTGICMIGIALFTAGQALLGGASVSSLDFKALAFAVVGGIGFIVAGDASAFKGFIEKLGAGEEKK